MRLSWKGLIFAPLLVPAIFSLTMLVVLQGNNPLLLFVLLAVSCFVSYGITTFIFLPSLFLLSSWRPLSVYNVCLLGLVLGALFIFPVTLIEWKSSGPDSGPPTENFVSFFLRWNTDPTTLIWPVAGLMTAGLYWWLGTWRKKRAKP